MNNILDLLNMVLLGQIQQCTNVWSTASYLTTLLDFMNSLNSIGIFVRKELHLKNIVVKNCAMLDYKNLNQIKILHYNILNDIYINGGSWNTYNAYCVETLSFETNTCLTHFTLLAFFYTPWKHQKTRVFMMFSGGIERY